MLLKRLPYEICNTERALYICGCVYERSFNVNNIHEASETTRKIPNVFIDNDHDHYDLLTD